MNLLIQVSTVILWSSLSLANRLSPQSSVAIPSNAFAITSGLKHVDPSNNFEIQNMPAIQSQDTVGDCFGCGSATIAQKFLCDSDPEYKGTKCNQLPPDKTISQLSMVAWSETNEMKKKSDYQNDQIDNRATKVESDEKLMEEEDEYVQIPGDPDNHKNIKLYNKVSRFSSGSNALLNSGDYFTFIADSCYPFDQLVSKYGNKDSKLFEEIYSKTRKLYLKNKKTTEANSAHCDDCLKQLSADFNTTFSETALQSALLKETYGEFLFELLFHNCEPIEPSTSVRPNFLSLPGKGQKVEKNKAKSVLKEVIKNGHPVLITNLCLQVDNKTKKCTSSHTTVISGHRKICPSNDLKNQNCKNQVKIHNCWGADWQKLNNDGWIDEDSIFTYLNYGQTYIEEDQISWLK